MNPASSVATRLLPQRSVLSGAGNGDALENMAPGKLEEGSLCWVVDEESLYYLAKASTAAVSPPEVIATLLGASRPGRWLKYASGTSFYRWGNVYYVDQNAPPGGNGNIEAPFQTLRAAVEAAPSIPETAQINVAAGDYTNEGFIIFVDKRLTVIGTALLNQQGPATHGVFLSPTFTGDENKVLEMSQLNCGISPQSFDIVVVLRDAYCEMFGAANYFLCGGSPLTCRAGSVSGTANSVTVTNGLYSGGDINISLNALGAELVNSINLTNALVAESRIKASRVRCTRITTAHRLLILSTDFENSTVIEGPVAVDIASYNLGVRAGVAWPGDVDIIEVGTVLQPFLVDSGVGSNSNGGNPTPALPDNEVGDLFVCRVNQIIGVSPSMPAGWTLQHEQTDGVLISQLWTRDTRSTGGEVGTVTVTGGGGSPTQAQIDSYRYVAPSAFIESITGASFTAADPMAVPAPAVIAGGLGRLAVSFISSNGSVPPDPTVITGQTGGTWVERELWFSGLGGIMDVQTAALSEDGTITGGTSTVPGTRANIIGFALVGDVL